MEDLPPVPRFVYVTGREDASREKTCVVKMRGWDGQSAVDRGAGARGAENNHHSHCGQSHRDRGFGEGARAHLLRGQGFPQGLHRGGGEPAGHRPLKLPRRRQHISAPSSCVRVRAGGHHQHLRRQIKIREFDHVEFMMIHKKFTLCYRRRRSSESKAAAASLAHSTGVTATALTLGMGAYITPVGLPLRFSEDAFGPGWL